MPVHTLIRRFLSKTLPWLAPFSFAIPTHAATEGTTVFLNVSVVTMKGAALCRNCVVEVRGNLIHAVVPARRYKVPAGAEVIDGHGHFLIPGLADMHTHVAEYSADPSFLAQYLAYGVTTIRLLSGNPQLLALRDQIAGGAMLAPRMWLSGPILTGPAGFSGSGNPQQVLVDGPEQARRVVDAQVDAGYDLIKLYDGLSSESFLAAAREAKARGAYVIGHLPDQMPLELVLGSGLDEIAHVDELVSYHWIGYDPAKQYGPSAILGLRIDHANIGRTAKLIHRHGLAIVSNLVTDQTVYEGIADTAALLHRPEYREVPAALRTQWQARGRFVKWRGQAEYRRDVIQPFLRQMVVALERAAVPITVGSDLGVEGMVPGFHTVRDIELLEAAGLTPFEALAAGTRNAAEIARRMGKPDNWGRIAPGCRADLVLLAANPLVTTRNLRLVRGVMANGRWLPPRQLAVLRLAGVAPAALPKP